MRAAAPLLPASELDDVDVATLLGRVEDAYQDPKSTSFYRKQLLLLYEALDVRDSELRARHANLCLKATNVAEGRAETFPRREDPRRCLTGWEKPIAELDVCVRAPALEPGRLVAAISERVEALGDMKAELRTASDAYEDCTRRLGELADHDDAETKDLVAAQVEAAQSQQEEAAAKKAELEPLYATGWQQVLTVTTALLRRRGDDPPDGCLQGLWSNVIETGMKIPATKNDAFFTMAVYATRFPEKAHIFYPAFQRLTMQTLPLVLAGDVNGAQLCALGLAALSDVELAMARTKQLGAQTRTLEAAAALMRPDCTVPTWLRRMAVTTGGCHLLALRETTPQAEGLLALFLHRLFVAPPTKLQKEEKEMLAWLVGAVAAKRKELLIPSVRLACLRFESLGELGKQLAVQVADDVATARELAWAFAAAAAANSGHFSKDALDGVAHFARLLLGAGDADAALHGFLRAKKGYLPIGVHGAEAPFVQELSAAMRARIDCADRCPSGLHTLLPRIFNAKDEEVIMAKQVVKAKAFEKAMADKRRRTDDDEAGAEDVDALSDEEESPVATEPAAMAKAIESALEHSMSEAGGEKENAPANVA